MDHEVIHTVNARSVGLEGDQNVGGLDVILVGNLLHDFVSEQGRVVRSERGVGRDGDSLGVAEIYNILLGA
jgi:hypothetical protein